jgi:hypothetical protein
VELKEEEIMKLTVLYRTDDSLVPRNSNSFIEDDSLVIVGPSFAAFKPKKDSKVCHIPKKEIGSPCTAFLKEICGFKKRITCPFFVQCRNRSNSMVLSNGFWNICFGCDKLKGNLVFNAITNTIVSHSRPSPTRILHLN